MIDILLILLALLQPDPHLDARWDTATSATIAWTQTARGCLYVTHATGENVFLSCYEKPGSYRITLGAGPTDGTARPQAHDVYILVTNGDVWRTQLGGRNVYLPVWRG